MATSRPHQLGHGPLTVRRVVYDAMAMLRQSFWRIAGVALVFFALPVVIAAGADLLITALEPREGPFLGVTKVAALVVVVALQVLGPVAFAGFLDEAVAKEYLHGHHNRLGDVLRNLPWRPLIIADVIVVICVGIGLALFVIPGLIAFGLLGLVGPVVVQEGATVRESFRRTIRLSRSAPMLVGIVVVLPFAFEEVLHALIYETLHSSGIGVQVVAEWIVAIIVGGTLGLLEVALATELMARHPRSLDDGQVPAV